LIFGGKEDVGNGKQSQHDIIDVFSWQDRDVAAGICILQEAGGLVTTANPPANPESDPIPDVRLGSRLYLAIRYVDQNPESSDLTAV
jgi:hypothetical protein